ncbi:hypothetical protein, partial [Burkholderia multivorans]
ELTGTATTNTSSSRFAPRSPVILDEPFVCLREKRRRNCKAAAAWRDEDAHGTARRMPLLRSPVAG